MPRFRIIALVAALAIVVGVLVVMWSLSDDPGPDASPSPSGSWGLSPSPTQSSPSPSESPSASASAENPSPTPPPAADDRASVEPFISNAIYDADAKTVTVFAFVPGLAETAGTCTATLEGGASVSAAASLEVATTTCSPLVINVNETPAAGATVTVTFESATSVGTSQPAEVTS